jgi:hypothetical protein
MHQKYKRRIQRNIHNFTWAPHCYTLPIMMKTLLFSDIYRIQIVQNTTQLSLKGRFNQPTLLLIH